jgi:hypothetical protein
MAVKVVHLAHLAYLKRNTTSVGMLSLDVMLLLRKNQRLTRTKTLTERR